MSAIRLGMKRGGRPSTLDCSEAAPETPHYWGHRARVRERVMKSGVDALADVALRFEVDGVSMPGRGLSTDVVEASARALLNALNRIVRVRDTGEDPTAVARPGSLR